MRVSEKSIESQSRKTPGHSESEKYPEKYLNYKKSKKFQVPGILNFRIGKNAKNPIQKLPLAVVAFCGVSYLTKKLNPIGKDSMKFLQKDLSSGIFWEKSQKLRDLGSKKNPIPKPPLTSDYNSHLLHGLSIL